MSFKLPVPFVLSDQNFEHIPHLSHAYCMHCPSHPSKMLQGNIIIEMFIFV
jgi:hypothetical protein